MHGIIFKDPMINTFSPNKLKIFLFDFILNPYQTKAQFAEGSEPPDLLTTLPPLLVAHLFLEFSNLPPTTLQHLSLSLYLCVQLHPNTSFFIKTSYNEG